MKKNEKKKEEIMDKLLERKEKSGLDSYPVFFVSGGSTPVFPLPFI